MSAEAVPSLAGAVTIQPLYDRILVQREPEKTVTDGGLEIPDQAKEKPSKGTVLAVGEGRLLDNGSIAPLRVGVGDRIAFGLFAGLNLPDDFGKDLLILSEAEVIGIMARG